MRYPLASRGYGANWTKRFQFTEKQKDDLLKAWLGKSNPKTRMEKAEGFIPIAQGVVETWLSHTNGATLAKERRDQTKDYTNALKALKKAYETLPDDTYAGISAFTDETLLLSTNPQYKQVAEALTDAVGRPGFKSADTFIIDMLDVMYEGAELALADIETHTGPNLDANRSLVDALAKEYQSFFGKPAPYYKGSYFVEFIKVIAKIVGAEIGPKLIGKVLKSEITRP